MCIRGCNCSRGGASGSVFGIVTWPRICMCMHAQEHSCMDAWMVRHGAPMCRVCSCVDLIIQMRLCCGLKGCRVVHATVTAEGWILCLFIDIRIRSI